MFLQVARTTDADVLTAKVQGDSSVVLLQHSPKQACLEYSLTFGTMPPVMIQVERHATPTSPVQYPNLAVKDSHPADTDLTSVGFIIPDVDKPTFTPLNARYAPNIPCANSFAPLARQFGRRYQGVLLTCSRKHSGYPGFLHLKAKADRFIKRSSIRHSYQSGKEHIRVSYPVTHSVYVGSTHADEDDDHNSEESQNDRAARLKRYNARRDAIIAAKREADAKQMELKALEDSLKEEFVDLTAEQHDNEHLDQLRTEFSQQLHEKDEQLRRQETEAQQLKESLKLLQEQMQRLSNQQSGMPHMQGMTSSFNPHSYSALQPVITDAFGEENLSWVQPYTRNWARFKFPQASNPKFPRFNGTGDPKQHLAHFQAMCGDWGTYEAYLL